MAVIHLETLINASPEICFDLSRSIDLHQVSMAKSDEKSISGKVSGLINLNESVTWRARHFGLKWNMTVKITVMERPTSFKDEMVEGPFAHMQHIHLFLSDGSQTVMRDMFSYDVPFGILGKLVDRCILKNYMTKLLRQRNKTIKAEAESANI
jgi:ligand-binding SRPBCC domain-containing protein